MDQKDFSSSHPPLPPISEEGLLSCLRLLRSRRVGTVTFYRLLSQHGSAQAALDALPEIARAAGEQDYQPCPEGVALAELRAGRKAGARPLWRGEAGYPPLLAEISDAPPMLWARGPLAPPAASLVGVVGARNASSLGLRMTRKLVGEMAELGLTTVSGLARGIDAVAHETSLETGTVAVVAGGVDVAYPTENAALMDEIAAKGLVVSEMPLGTKPQARHFPRRNRIISGLSRALVVVEAAAKSGSLITAELALDQGREVLAVPGHPFDARAGGCNQLIRDGATLVRGASDIRELLDTALPAEPAPAFAAHAAPSTPVAPTAIPAIPPAPEAPPQRGLRAIAALHRQVLDRLGPSPMAEDQLIRDFRAPAAEVSSVLVDLELEGKIERQAGGMLASKKST